VPLRSICRRLMTCASDWGSAGEAGAVAGLIEAQRRASGAEVAQQPTVQLNVSFVSPASPREPTRGCVSPRGEFFAIEPRD
jgi:hypothetical protein